MFELLVVTEAIRALVSDRAPLEALRAAARAGGLRTLAEEGRRLIAEGVTTAVEASRVIESADTSLDIPEPGA